MSKQVKLIRPDWDYSQYHRDSWMGWNVTAIMCERDTADVTRLGIESLLRFYPDLPILIIDGGSKDDSLRHLRWLSHCHPNIRIWEREGRNGHGTMLNEGIRGFINTEYILLLDNDIIVRRGGWIEELVEALAESDNTYAIGTLMEVTDKNDGCGKPDGEGDILRYTHPSCSMVKRSMYLTMAPFVEHGAPLVFNMKTAKQRGYNVAYYPIDKYVAHLSGASWIKPYRPVWKDDMGVNSRPFITFLAGRDTDINPLVMQDNRDFEIIPTGEWTKAKVHIFGHGSYDITNDLYAIRFRVHGEYICRLRVTPGVIKDTLVSEVKMLLENTGYPDEFKYAGMHFIKRSLWQQRECLS